MIYNAVLSRFYFVIVFLNGNTPTFLSRRNNLREEIMTLDKYSNI